ncbi:hypothetical protein [Nocardiopsis sp. CNT312]|uniref:hypothetical protein n=1 Tax=Nocardiopsis sp. CNT312 TaxID=1137268 RepID=UPI00048C07FF|nr:hypothetical protein [Nocardiopsis sp. CNT312]
MTVDHNAPPQRTAARTGRTRSAPRAFGLALLPLAAAAVVTGTATAAAADDGTAIAVGGRPGHTEFELGYEHRTLRIGGDGARLTLVRSTVDEDGSATYTESEYFAGPGGAGADIVRTWVD